MKHLQRTAGAQGEKSAEEALAWKASRIKMIPHIEEGGFVVKKVVGSRPALIGKDAQLTKVYSGENYVEVDMDISSNYMAGKILSVCQGAAASLVVDLGFVVEARPCTDDGDGSQLEGELPERLLCAFRMHRMQMDSLPVG